MLRTFDIVIKDIHQILIDRQSFLFLLIMPVAFTFLFGYASGGFSSGTSDSRLPVGFISRDSNWFSQELRNLLADSEIIRLQEFSASKQDEMENLIANEKLAAGLIIPEHYGAHFLKGKPGKIILIADDSATSTTTIKSTVLSTLIRLDSATQTANIMEQMVGNQTPFDYIFEETLSAWETPPIRIDEIKSDAIDPDVNEALAHISPGMMLQFAIASLMTSAQIIVNERKSRSLQRLFTTATSRIHILTGHFIAIFVIIFCQFTLLIIFGTFALQVNYLRNPPATLLVAISSALCIAALGLLVGVVSKNEDQAVVFSLIPMFVFSGIGGAWMPLEFTSPTFQMIGHVSPIAWAMDGFENIAIRGLGFNSVLLPAAALVGYAILFFSLAAWRFQVTQEQ
ncbi:MAG: ABC transporter permease [Anaerolineales bacterium]|nr:ABC transporter permease [Anaerolineales bacterium]